MNTVGARTLKGISSPETVGYRNLCIAPAPNRRISMAIPPDMIENISALLNIFAEFLYSLLAILAEINFDTAIGIPYEERISTML